MPIITLPDGSQRTFEHPVSVLEVAQSIGAGLAKATVQPAQTMQTCVCSSPCNSGRGGACLAEAA